MLGIAIKNHKQYDPSMSDPVGRVADLLERIGRLLRGTRHRNERLNPAQWEALRYLGRANRYSRTPTALTHYLGATKGTVSQTLIALERKGLVRRAADPRDRRGVRLGLTSRGRSHLQQDPMADVIAGVDPELLQRLDANLSELLLQLQRSNRQRPFGQCGRCRFFRAGDAADEPGGPNRCGLTLEPLSDLEGEQICAEHEASTPPS
jgi:DNA-binding MarR family transcriptional regulator